MKSALLISFGFHLAVALLSFHLVKFNRVNFVQRQVYTVNAVTLEEIQKKPAVKPAPPKPQPVPEQEEEKEELVTPKPDKKKPDVKPDKQKTVPTTEVKKTNQPPEPNPKEQPEEQPVTGQVAFDGQEFPFAYYVTGMRRQIAAKWRVPSSSMESMNCVVYFRIERDGIVQTPSIETSSGHFLFDQAALRAVVEASPFPPLPSGFTESYLGVHFSFAYEHY